MFDTSETTPNNREAEEALIGAVIISPNIWQEVSSVLVGDFYYEENRCIWEAIASCLRNDIHLDQLTIIDELKSKGKLETAGGEVRIWGLQEATPTTLHAADHAKIIQETSYRRRLFRLASDLAKASCNPTKDPAEVIDQITEASRSCNLRDLKLPERYTVAELYDLKLPDPKWAIPDMVPEGVTILGGRPKVGKSWMALQMAHSVGCGGMFFGRKIEKGNVLYIALEDGPKRLQNRISKHKIPRDACITFVRDWEPLYKDGLAILYAEIIQHDYRLIIIDTLTRALRGLDQNDQPAIDVVMSNVQRMANDQHVSILFNDHTNKPRGTLGDPVDDIMNSTVKTAVVDMVLALYREQGNKSAKLKGRGRDADEVDLTVNWDPELFYWQCEGESGQVKLTGSKKDILDVLQLLGKSSCQQVAKEAGKDRDNTRKLLNELYIAGLVKREVINGNVLYYLS